MSHTIFPGTISAPSCKLPIKPRRFYYIGIAGQAIRVFVTAVTDRYISYVEHPYYKAEEVSEQEHMFHYLCKRATLMRVKSCKDMIVRFKDQKDIAELYQAEIFLLNSFLSGNNIFPEETLSGYKPIRIKVYVKHSYQDGHLDFYQVAASSYGHVGFISSEPYKFYITTTAKTLEKIEGDGFFEIVEIKEL